MLPHPITNFEIQKYYQNEPRFSGVYSINNLHKTMDVEYVISLDEYESVRTHWIALYVNGDSVTYVDSYGVKYILKKNIGNKNITANIYRIQENDSITWG